MRERRKVGFRGANLSQNMMVRRRWVSEVPTLLR
jgi:hypothetical protein